MAGRARVPAGAGQAVLGGIVVATELNPWWVTAHFIAALVLIADVTYLAAACLTSDRPRPSAATRRRAVRRLTLDHAGRRSARCCWSARSSGPATPNWSSRTGPDGRRLIPSVRRRGCARDVHPPGPGAARVLVRPVDDDPGACHGDALASPGGRSPTVAFRSSSPRSLSGAANVITRLKPWAVVAHVALSVLIWATPGGPGHRRCVAGAGSRSRASDAPTPISRRHGGSTDAGGRHLVVATRQRLRTG